MITLRVKQFREAAGLSQTRLAEMAGVRRATLFEIEKGENAGIDFEILDRLAVALSVNAAILIVHNPGKPQPLRRARAKRASARMLNVRPRKRATAR